MSADLARASWACPRCGGDLAPEIVGAFALRRCAGCGGVWLDPDAFRAACVGDDRFDAATPPPRDAADAADAADATYLRCPACGDVMSRVNFGHVSGVIIDVCRPHGAWLDAGELRAIRRFVRGSGPARFARWRRTREALRERPAAPAAGGRTAGSGFDLLVDALAGIPDAWDVPSTRSAARWFLRAAVLGLLAAVFLYLGYPSWPGPSWRWRSAAAGFGVGGVLALAALRALSRGRARRRAERLARR